MRKKTKELYDPYVLEKIRPAGGISFGHERYSRLDYKVGHVYDIADTNFPVEKYPTLYSVGYESELHGKVYEGLVNFNQEVLQCTVMEEDMNSIALRGSYSFSSHKIVINDRLKDTEKLSTLAHETGHAITLSKAEVKEDNPTFVREFEADAIGILIVSGMGLPVEEQRKAHLAHNYRKITQEMEQIAETMYTDVKISVDGILSNVIDLYRKNVNLMYEKINQVLDPDRDIHRKEKKSEMESNKKICFLQKSLDILMTGEKALQKGKWKLKGAINGTLS